jgi:nucleotidyltransferase substrate binding protein (TIGR01987 family)
MSDAMNKKDVRWRQRFQNYQQALARLNEAVALSRQRALSDLEQQGLVQAFEFTHELAWNVLKDYLEEQGYAGIIGSKNATREAFKNGLLEDGESWMDMIKARNLTSHTYHTKIAEDIVKDILGRFHPALVAIETRLAQLEKKESDGE